MRGELHWSLRDHGWEILIPSVAFKNSNSSFFGSKPFRLILPDLGGLYDKIETYVDQHRARLIGPERLTTWRAQLAMLPVSCYLARHHVA